jgi:hypothetical protein
LRARGAQHKKNNGNGKKLPDRGREGGAGGERDAVYFFCVLLRESFGLIFHKKMGYGAYYGYEAVGVEGYFVCESDE